MALLNPMLLAVGAHGAHANTHNEGDHGKGRRTGKLKQVAIAPDNDKQDVQSPVRPQSPDISLEAAARREAAKPRAGRFQAGATGPDGCQNALSSASVLPPIAPDPDLTARLARLESKMERVLALLEKPEPDGR